MIEDKEFEKIVAEAIDQIPKRYLDRLDNVAFIVEDEPSLETRKNLGLAPFQTLLGLYEGAPLPSRQGQLKMLPDKITLYKKPLIQASHSRKDLKRRIKNTIWHEAAHFFGLDHRRIDELDNKSRDI